MSAGSVGPGSKRDQDGTMLGLSFAAMVVIGLGNKVFNKLQTVPMHNYPFFLSLYSTFVYIPMSFAYIVPMIMYGTYITKEERQIPQRKFIVMGVLDAVSGLMQIFATNYLDGALVIMYVITLSGARDAMLSGTDDPHVQPG